MKKRILAYCKRVDELLDAANPETDWEEVMEEHLMQIGFFQHERLIHLIVTMSVAIMAMFSVGIYLVTSVVGMLLMTLLLFVLLVPYIMHYYLLENEVQKMYEQYDAILRFMK